MSRLIKSDFIKKKALSEIYIQLCLGKLQTYKNVGKLKLNVLLKSDFIIFESTLKTFFFTGWEG